MSNDVRLTKRSDIIERIVTRWDEEGKTGRGLMAAMILGLVATLSTAILGATFSASMNMAAVVIGVSVTAALAFAYSIHIILDERNWKRKHQVLQTEYMQIQTIYSGSSLDANHDVAAQPEMFGRFEDIIGGKRIKYGFVPFFPTISDSPGPNADAAGFGVELLQEIFGGRIEAAERRRTWDDIIEGLKNREYDVIATPLYDIRERRTDVSFSSPLFYADISAYAPASSIIFGDLVARNPAGVDFPELIQFLRDNAEQIEVSGMEGELQTKICRKYIGDRSVTALSKERYETEFFISGLLKKSGKGKGDVYFCERMHANACKDVKDGKVVSLLRPNQLLFPVAFAVLRGEDTLRKFINLRLLGLDTEHVGSTPVSSGIFRTLEAAIRQRHPDVDENMIAAYYRRGYTILDDVEDDDQSNDTVVDFAGRRKT